VQKPGKFFLISRPTKTYFSKHTHSLNLIFPVRRLDLLSCRARPPFCIVACPPKTAPTSSLTAHDEFPYSPFILQIRHGLIRRETLPEVWLVQLRGFHATHFNEIIFITTGNRGLLHSITPWK